MLQHFKRRIRDIIIVDKIMKVDKLNKQSKHPILSKLICRPRKNGGTHSIKIESICSPVGRISRVLARGVELIPSFNPSDHGIC